MKEILFSYFLKLTYNKESLNPDESSLGTGVGYYKRPPYYPTYTHRTRLRDDTDREDYSRTKEKGDTGRINELLVLPGGRPCIFYLGVAVMEFPVLVVEGG